MTHEAIDNGITAILNQFTTSTLPSLETVNNVLDLSEILEDAPEHFPNCLRAVESNDSEQIKEAIFFANHRYLSDRILENPALTSVDAGCIIEDLARQLHQYDGNVTELGFRHWLTETAKPLVQFYAMKRQYARSVLAGVWSVLSSSADLGIEHNTLRDLEARVWLKVYLRLPDWLEPGRAALSTRLYAAGRYEARAWRTSRLRDRERFTTLDELVKIEDRLAQPRRTKAKAHELAKLSEDNQTVQ